MSTFAFSSVLFDLDGTLVATERYWPDAARSATRQFFAERGLPEVIPSTAEWLSMVGQPIESAFEEAFPGLDPKSRADLLAACAEEERKLVKIGRATLLPGVEEILTALRAQGVRLGVASNCGPDYLDQMMNGLGLSRWIEEARCLGLPGIANKADMIADLLMQFDTRSAVMVGDRRGDRDAAWANGLPHVHIPRGYGAGAEFGAEGILDGVDQLKACLGGRDEFLGGLVGFSSDPETWAVMGLPLAGKTLMAEDLRRLAAAQARPIEVLDDPAEAEAADADVRLFLTADEEVLVRRAKGQRTGMGPVDTLLRSALPAAREQQARVTSSEVTLLIDMSNPLAPELLSPR